MDKNTGERTEKTRTEIDVIGREISNAESLGNRPKQLRAKDTSHGLVSEMLIKGNGIKKANVLYRPDKVIKGKENSVINMPMPAIRINWKNKVREVTIVDKDGKWNKQNQKRNKTLSPKIQGTEQRENQEEPYKEQEITEKAQIGNNYSPTPFSTIVSPVPIYINIRYKNNARFHSEGKIEKTIRKKPKPEKHYFSNETINKTSCHNGRKSGKDTEKQDDIPAVSTEKNSAHLKTRKIEPCPLYMKKAGVSKLKGRKISFSYSQRIVHEEKDCTFCHDGRKLEKQHAGREENLGKQTAGKTATDRKRVKSSLCASYRALKKTGSAAVSTGQRTITTAMMVSESMSKFSEEGGELQAASETAFMAKDVAKSKVADKHAGKKAERTEKKYEKKRDTLLEQKAEIKQFIAKKKVDGTPLSKEEITMLEKKLGIANKKDKGEQTISDKRSKKLEKLQKSNVKKLRKTEGKLKNIPKKTNRELRKRNVSAQMRFQARNYIIRRLTDPNNDTEGTGLGGMLFSLAKTGGLGVLQKAFKKIGSLLLKILASILPAILVIIIVPILCLLLIGGIAGGNEEENQAQAQETSSEADYYLSSFNILYGHANNTITNNANIMKWKSEVKKELLKQGFDESWTDMVLCMMWQESKGLGNDIMQSGGATPKDSIRAGISVLKSALSKCIQYKSTDIKLVLYCYNYGPGFADYIYKEWDGVCSEKAAQERTNTMLASHPEWNVYGDPKYAQHVLQNYVFEENPDLNPDSTKWCQADKNNLNKCSLTSVTSYACKFIGNKYVWGGTSLTNGCDCSGFTQQIYKHFGVNIPRTSSAQSQSGKKISPLSDAEPGDLLFYGEGGKVNHVALYLGNNTIVHASNSKPYPSGGIKTTSPANYRPILAIRRYGK